MNYLAHILLSGKNGQIQVGNFIGDAVKGRSYENYPAHIRQGILLHRSIDDFADHHADVKQAVALAKVKFGRYAGVMTDMFFDYLLARNFRQYSGISLRYFTFRFYLSLVRNYFYLPVRIKRFVWHFILTDRLNRYASLRGLKQSLRIMAEYKKLPVDPEEAIVFLTEHERQLEKLFAHFFRKYGNSAGNNKLFVTFDTHIGFNLNYK